VTTEITEPIAGQRSAVQVLADLAAQHPELPAAFITIHQPWSGDPARLDMQLSTPTAFNLWRAVLDVDPNRVTLHPSGRGSWIEATTVHEGIPINISSHGILLTKDQLDAPRDTTEVSA